MNSPVLVIGTGRSGTSVIARLLHEELGVDMGGPGWEHESNGNLGDYENPYLKQLGHQRIEGVLSPERWKRSVQQFARTAPEPWGYKNPNIYLFLKDWLELFPKAPVIWAWRDIEACARSCERWYGWPMPKARQAMTQRAWRLEKALETEVPLEIQHSDQWGISISRFGERQAAIVNMNVRWEELVLKTALELVLALDKGDDDGDE